jgi:hypothetical protein
MSVAGTPTQFGPAYFQGITIGTLILQGNQATPNSAPDCSKAVDILNKSTIDTRSVKQASDPGFNLAAQLLGAMLNADVGAAVNCQDDKTAINYAIALLAKYGFNGYAAVAANHAGYHALSTSDAAIANTLATILDDYNNNLGCPGSPGVPVLPSLPPIAPLFVSKTTATISSAVGGNFYVEAVGSPQVTITSSSLPSGVTLSQVAPWVSFTPTPGVSLLMVASGAPKGTYTITFTAANGTLPNATQTFTLTIN